MAPPSPRRAADSVVGGMQQSHPSPERPDGPNSRVVTVDASPDPTGVRQPVAAVPAGVAVTGPVPRTMAADHRLGPPELTWQAPLLPRRRESPMAKSGNKRRGRKKKKANHGKRPNS